MTSATRVHILAISGSLRQASSNRALVEAAARLAADSVDVAVYRQLEELPPFNPDLDGLDPPAPVTRFRAALQACHGVLISSPERAWRGRCDEECARLGGGQWRAGGKAGGPHQRLTARDACARRVDGNAHRHVGAPRSRGVDHGSASGQRAGRQRRSQPTPGLPLRWALRSTLSLRWREVVWARHGNRDGR